MPGERLLLGEPLVERGDDGHLPERPVDAELACFGETDVCDVVIHVLRPFF